MGGKEKARPGTDKKDKRNGEEDDVEEDNKIWVIACTSATLDYIAREKFVSTAAMSTNQFFIPMATRLCFQIIVHIATKKH